MKIIVHIGPDTIGIEAASKQAVRRMLNRKIPNNPPTNVSQRGNLKYNFKGRKYCYSEIAEACILTYNEYWNAIKVI